MDNETKSTAVCKRCGKPISKSKHGTDDEQLYCSRCIIELAEEQIPESEPDYTEILKEEEQKRTRVKLAIQWSAILVCLVIIAIQLPKLISALETREKPIRSGSYATDTLTDQCIGNLWHIAKLLQDGKLPGNDIVCPASGKPYVIIKAGEDTVAHCSNPGLHGFKEIRTSRKTVRPRVIK